MITDFIAHDVLEEIEHNFTKELFTLFSRFLTSPGGDLVLPKIFSFFRF